MHLFYAVSRSFTKNFSNPGGDLFYKTSDDMGNTWSEGVLFYSEDDFDGNPKYFVNQLAVLPGGKWVLPFGTTAPGYPRTAGKAGVLISSDGGDTWQESGNLTIEKAPYISAILEPAISPGGELIMMRSGNGWLYQSHRANDLRTAGSVSVFFEARATVGMKERDPSLWNWTQPTKTSVPNPNSRPSICGGGGGGNTTANGRKGPDSKLYLASNSDNQNISGSVEFLFA